MTFEIIDTDILIVGAGGAGCRAAIAASDSNKEVTIITKDILGKAHTVMAEGGINAALANLDPQDLSEIHASDTCKAGAYLNDQTLAEILAEDSPQRVYDLENIGAIFSRTPDGLIMQRPLCHNVAIWCQVFFPNTCPTASNTRL